MNGLPPLVMTPLSVLVVFSSKRFDVVCMLPATVRRLDGVVVPMPTLPLARILKNDVPDEDATLNGLSEPVPFTLKDIVEEVAFTPETVPLSRRIPDVRDVGVNHVATFPIVPPDNPVIPREDVATHSVEVPVDQSTCPSVPEALMESMNLPVRARLVVVELVKLPLVPVSVPMNPLVKDSPVPEIAVVEALVKYVCPETERAVAEAVLR